MLIMHIFYLNGFAALLHEGEKHGAFNNARSGYRFGNPGQGA